MYFYLSADQMTRFRLTVKPRLTREENLAASSYRKHDLRTFQFDSDAHVPITERSVAHALHIHMAGADCIADSIAQASRLKGTFKRSDVHSHRDGLHKAAYRQEQDTAYIWCIWLISMPPVLENILSSSRFCLDERSYRTTRNLTNFHISALPAVVVNWTLRNELLGSCFESWKIFQHFEANIFPQAKSNYVRV